MSFFDKPFSTSEGIALALAFAAVVGSGYMGQWQRSKMLATKPCDNLRQELDWNDLPNRCLTRAEYEQRSCNRGHCVESFAFTGPGLF